MFGRVLKVFEIFEQYLIDTVLLVGDDFGWEGLRFHFGTGTHSALWKHYAVTLVLVHIS